MRYRTLNGHLACFIFIFPFLLAWSIVVDGDERDYEEDLCHAKCICLDSFFQCGRRGLKALPSDLPTWITHLDLSQNEIESIDPLLLSTFIHLQSLSLDGNNLTRVPTTKTSPADDSPLEYLTNLTLSRNVIETIDSSRLGSFTSLRHLDLNRNLILQLTNTSFPSPSFLHSLNLDSNIIETLESHSLGPLSSLTDLHLAKNRIRFIARDALSQLKNLERLDLSRNKLQTLDSLRFQDLKKLQVLNLRRNPISNLSDAAFYGLDNIQHLYLEWSNIRVVEKRWLYGLRSLHTLNLSHNQITKVEDESCDSLEELQILDLKMNLLEGISQKTFFGLVSLRSLDLSNNQIVDLESDSFIGLKQLETLDLSENRLSWAVEDLASPFRGLKELTTLNLASNQIHFLYGDALKGLLNLKLLNLSSNPLAWLSEKSLVPVPKSAIIILTQVTSFLCDCETVWLQSRLGATSGPTRLRHVASGRASKKGDRSGSSILSGRGGPLCSFPTSLYNKHLLDISPEQLSCPDNSPKPLFLTEPVTQVLLVEGNGSLHCSVQSYTPSVRIHWRKDHQDLPKHLESGVKSRMEAGNEESAFVFHSTVDIFNVSWNDVGCYQCVAQNDLGVVYSAKANITVHVFPSFVKKPSNVTVRLGSNAKLECGAKGFPMPEIAFQKDGGEDFPAALDRRFHVMPNDDSFFIMEVKLADMGIYSCSAKNAAGEIRANASVTVYETPSFSEPLEDESAIEGSNAILECMSTGSPKPIISWAKEGISILEGRDKRVHFTENGSLLLIKDVQLSDSGRYECLLTNAVGTARGVSTLTVLNSSSVKTLNLDNAAMTIIFIIIAVFCVVVTSAAWVVVIYRTRKKIKTTHLCPNESAPLRHSKFDDFEREMASFQPLPYNQVTKVICGDGESESSSGKDSGTGDDIPESTGGSAHGGVGSGPGDLEDDTLLRRQPRAGVSLESFSTFGTRAPSSRWSSQQMQFRQQQQLQQPRLDLKSDTQSVISAIKDYGGKAKSIPLPVPPPLPHLQMQLAAVCIHKDNRQSQISPSSSSRGRRNSSKEEDFEVEQDGASLLIAPSSTQGHTVDALSTSTPV